MDDVHKEDYLLLIYVCIDRFVKDILWLYLENITEHSLSYLHCPIYIEYRVINRYDVDIEYRNLIPIKYPHSSRNLKGKGDIDGLCELLHNIFIYYVFKLITWMINCKFRQTHFMVWQCYTCDQSLSANGAELMFLSHPNLNKK